MHTSAGDRSRPIRPGRGRRPAGEVRAAALSATAELLFEHGLRAVTFDKVAARAGVSKMTLYRWWPSPGALALDAYFAATEPTLAFTDTGDIACDLRMQLHAFVGFLTSPRQGAAIRELVGAAQTDADLAAAMTERYTNPRRALAVDLLEAAQRRGEIRPDVDLDVLVDQLWGACYHRLLLPARPLSKEFADSLVENLLAGVRTRPRARERA